MSMIRDIQELAFEKGASSCNRTQSEVQALFPNSESATAFTLCLKSFQVSVETKHTSVTVRLT